MIWNLSLGIKIIEVLVNLPLSCVLGIILSKSVNFQITSLNVYIGQGISNNSGNCFYCQQITGAMLFTYFIFLPKLRFEKFFRLCKSIDFLLNWIASGNVLNINTYKSFDNCSVFDYRQYCDASIFDAVWSHSYWDI